MNDATLIAFPIPANVTAKDILADYEIGTLKLFQNAGNDFSVIRYLRSLAAPPTRSSSSIVLTTPHNLGVNVSPVDKDLVYANAQVDGLKKGEENLIPGIIRALKLAPIVGAWIFPVDHEFPEHKTVLRHLSFKKGQHRILEVHFEFNRKPYVWKPNTELLLVKHK